MKLSIIKIFCLILVGTTMCVSINAQTIRLSQKYTTQTVADPTFTSYMLNDYFYVIQDKFNMKSNINRDVQMDVFDNKGEFVSTTGLLDVNMEMGEAGIWQGIFPLADKMVLFKSKFVKEGDTKHYDLYAFPFSDLTKKDKGVKTTSTSSESALNTGDFFIEVSPDASKFVVLTRHPYIKGEREKCTITVYDNSFKELWSKPYVFPFDNTKYPGNTVFVNNSGSVFILKNIENKTEDPYQSVISITANGAGIKENRLAMGEQGKISTYGYAFNLQGDLIISGLYFNDKKFGINVEKPKGIFYLKMNSSDGSLASSGFTPKDFSQRTKTVSAILLANDEVILTAEEQTVKSTSIPEKPLEYNYEYTNGNIFVSKVNSKGEELWQQIIKRDVKSFNDGGKSNGVFTGIINGNISIIYRDYLYKHDGKNRAVVGAVALSKFINAHSIIGMDGKIISNTYIQRLGNDDNQEAVVIYALPQTGKLQDEKNVLFMGCSDKILYGIKITF